jgi:hypothetical protein
VAIRHSLDRICDLDQPAGGFVAVGKWTVSGEFHRFVLAGIFIATFGMSQ